jgi:hypothetical protein
LPVNELEMKLAETCRELNIDYAFTGFSAAARLAPMVRYQKVMAYIPGKAALQKLEEKLELKRVVSGANTMLMIPYDDGVYYGGMIKDDIQIVSPIQAYLDLKSYKGRGEEAAEEIYKEAIMIKW